MGDFERKMDSKGYRFLKIVADLFVVNFEFLFTVIFSLTFLFFPSLFALIELCKKEKVTFIDNTDLVKQEYYSDDGIHMSPSYYTKWVDHMAEAAGL